MEETVTTKNTKTQILEAYNNLLEKVRSQKSEAPKKEQEQKQKEELAGKAKSLSNEGIIKEVSELKVGISSSLDKLADQFVAEYKKFEDLQKAISIEKQNLEDLYQLSANADSLAAMLMAQKEQREKFEEEMERRKQELTEKINTEKANHEAEMQEKRERWKKEQDERAAEEKEQADRIKKEREREAEEYQYNLKISRKKEADIYEDKKQKLEKELVDKKAAFEKEFQERKIKMEESEAELEELRKKNAAFPGELEKAVNDAVKQTVDKLKAEHKFEMQLRDKEVEGELKLKDQTISALNAKIKEMEASMKEMSQKTAIAETGVKEIAIKAIESKSKSYFIEKNRENQEKD